LAAIKPDKTAGMTSTSHWLNAMETLRNYIRAMGGELEIVATFPDGQVRIENFAS